MPIASKLFSDGVDRPALVLVHGLGSAGTIWKSLTPALLNHFKVITVDLPGHGSAPIHPDEKVDPKSLAQAIFEEVSKEHEIDQCHVAGNSLGGWIALEMGALGPNKVKSVTALAPAGLWHKGTTKRFPPSLDARILAKISLALLLVKFPLMFESFKTSFFFPENITLSFVSGILSGLCCFVIMITGASFLTVSFSSISNLS